MNDPAFEQLKIDTKYFVRHAHEQLKIDTKYFHGIIKEKDKEIARLKEALKEIHEIDAHPLVCWCKRIAKKALKVV